MRTLENQSNQRFQYFRSQEMRWQVGKDYKGFGVCS